MNTDQPKQGMATTSLVLGILSVLCLSLFAGIPAIITGHVAHQRARKSPALYGGAGLAIAGFVLGYVSLGLALLAIPFLASRLLPSLTQAKAKAESITCINNMKQIGLAFRIFATDHEDQFPFNLSTNDGGTLELCRPGADGYDENIAAHFLVLSNELANPRILVCPSDSDKQPAASWLDLTAANISYQVRTGTNVSGTNPQEILARCPIHNTMGYCDGSVHRGIGR